MESPKVLIVDDNPADLEFVAGALADMGYRLATETDAIRALKRFEDEGPWHLVISDLKMPGMDGLTLLKKIKARDPLTETIIITAHADTSSAVEALGLGAFSYLAKPLHHQELRHSVGQAVERVRLGAEQRRLIRELEERDARRRREIATIASIGDALSRTGRAMELSDDLVRKIATALGAEGVVLFLLDEARNELVLTSHEGLPQAIVDELALRRLPAAECTMGCPLLIEENASLDQWPCTGVFRAAGVNSFLAVPVTSQQELIGCLVALTLTRRVRVFTLEEREFLEAIGYLIGNALAARRKEQQARDAEKLAAVGELAAGVAHELGNVLAIVGGSVQFLLANMDVAAPFREHLEVIHRNVAGGDRIIKGLLSFARPSPPSLEATNIESVLERACALLQGEMANARVILSRHYAPNLPQVVADGQQMQQVFLNILLNAIQAMPRGGLLTLRTFTEPPDPPWAGVRVEIADTGAGIPAEYLHRVFDPFFTTKQGGTGLGLSVSHRIVAGHGGELRVKSQEGRGTRFTVRLPTRLRASLRRADAGMSDSVAPPDHGRAA